MRLSSISAYNYFYMFFKKNNVEKRIGSCVNVCNDRYEVILIQFNVFMQ